MFGSWSHFNSALTKPTDRYNFGNSASHDRPGHLFSLPQQRKLIGLNLSQPSSNSPVGITRRVCCKRVIKLNHRNMFWVPQLFGVFSVRTLGLDEDLTPCTERTMCSFMGLAFLFRGLVRLWRSIDLHMLKRVSILTMDVLCELIDFSRDPAVLGSRHFPNTLCVSQEN